MPIYTKKGDDGTTGLLGGKRTHKTDPRIEALGTVDELNACLGICASLINDQNKELKPLQKLILEVQDKLFSIGSNLAKPQDAENVTVPKRPTEKDISNLEKKIDEFDTNVLSQLKNFILPGGHPLSAQLQLARSICRRAERRLFGLNANPVHQKYLNRLSDYLFTLARVANALTKTKETTWKA
jgi:cob(I)alamin adenosyltransferase